MIGRVLKFSVRLAIAIAIAAIGYLLMIGAAASIWAMFR